MLLGEEVNTLLISYLRNEFNELGLKQVRIAGLLLG
jgi:hypothetical protein